MSGGEAKAENPKEAVLIGESSLRERLIKLDIVICQIRAELLGAKPTSEQDKADVSGSGFFSEMQQRLREDIRVVDSIAAYACEVRDSLSES